MVTFFISELNTKICISLTTSAESNRGEHLKRLRLQSSVSPTPSTATSAEWLASSDESECNGISSHPPQPNLAELESQNGSGSGSSVSAGQWASLIHSSIFTDSRHGMPNFWAAASFWRTKFTGSFSNWSAMDAIARPSKWMAKQCGIAKFYNWENGHKLPRSWVECKVLLVNTPASSMSKKGVEKGGIYATLNVFKIQQFTPSHWPIEDFTKCSSPRTCLCE